MRGIRLIRQGLDTNWTDNNKLASRRPVSPGEDTITLGAINFSGEVIGSDTITVNNTFEPASVNIAISRVIYAGNWRQR
jgi:hypothetical protein